MLEFNHKAMRGTDISDVPFPRFLIALDKLLAFDREVVFPRAVPVGFLFGPGIAIPNSPMRPVGDSVRPTFGNNLAIATATLRPPAGVGFNKLIACKCKSHLQRLHLGSQEIGSAYLHRARRQHDSVNATSSIVTVAIVMMVMMIIPAIVVTLIALRAVMMIMVVTMMVMMPPTVMVMTIMADICAGSPRMSALGQKAKYSLRADVFRCSPNNGSPVMVAM
jgi:hypothetical protein